MGELIPRGPALSRLLSFSHLPQSEIRVGLKVGHSCPLFVAVIDCILCFGLIIRIATLKMSSVGWLYRSYIHTFGMSSTGLDHSMLSLFFFFF